MKKDRNKNRVGHHQGEHAHRDGSSHRHHHKHLKHTHHHHNKVPARTKGQSAGHHHHHHHRFHDAQRWAKKFEDPERDAWQKPELLLDYLDIQKTDNIADIGSATGYFPIRLAKYAPGGHVWGVDVEPDMVRYLNERAEREEIKNVYSILGTPSDPLLPEKVHWVFVVNTYHHISNRSGYFQNIQRYLHPGAHLVIVDFKKKELPIGPPPARKIAKEEIIAEVTKADYALLKGEDILPYQNVLVFRWQAKGAK